MTNRLGSAHFALGSLAVAWMVVLCGAGPQDAGRILEPGSPKVSLSKHPVKIPVQAKLPADLGEPGTLMLDPANLVERLGDVLAHLEDASFEQREAAMDQLLEACDGDADALRTVLEILPLTAEQHQRVLQGLRQSLVSRPRGALGISMQFVRMNAADAGEIVVTGLVPELPAERVLRLGDRITSLDGMPIMQQLDLVAQVQAKRPGELVHLVIRRAKVDDHGRPVMDNGQTVYETLDMDIQLGSAELLRQSEERQPPSPVVLTRMAQASAAVQALAIRPRHVEFRDGDAGDLQLTIDLSPAAVENHPAIRQLLLEKRLINEGRMPMSEELNREWNERAQRLLEESNDPAASAAQLALAEAVLERYLELLGQ